MTNLTFLCFAKKIDYMPVHDAFEEVFWNLFTLIEEIFADH